MKNAHGQISPELLRQSYDAPPSIWVPAIGCPSLVVRCDMGLLWCERRVMRTMEARAQHAEVQDMDPQA